jgi:hypothetical protein
MRNDVLKFNVIKLEAVWRSLSTESYVKLLKLND